MMGISGDQDISGQNISKSGSQGEENAEKRVAGFERLWIWQRAYMLMLEIHKLCRHLPREEYLKVKDQLERSSASVAANISEGHTSYYYQDKIKGFYVARKEAGETQNHLRTMEGKGYIKKALVNQLVLQYEEVIRGINGYINWVRDKRGANKLS